LEEREMVILGPEPEAGEGEAAAGDDPEVTFEDPLPEPIDWETALPMELLDSPEAEGVRRLRRLRQGLAEGVVATMRPPLRRCWRPLRAYWKAMEVGRSRGRGEVTARIFYTGLLRFNCPITKQQLAALLPVYATPATQRHLRENPQDDLAAAVVREAPQDSVHVMYEKFLKACVPEW
jgi:hypothetical protein